MLANSRTPSEKARATYEMNSIRTSSGTRGPGVPAGMKYEKKCTPCVASARIVTPRNTVTDRPIATITDDVRENPYGTLANRLPNRMKKNREYRKGRYCSFVLPICSLVCECTVVYADSNPSDHRLGTSRCPLSARMCSPRKNTSTRVVYSPRLVSVRFEPRIGASIPTSLVTSNWSRGEAKKCVVMFIYYR